MSQEEYRKHQRQQGEERIRRGYVGFTRPKRAEDVLGSTAGESKLSNTQRRSQSGKRPR